MDVPEPATVAGLREQVTPVGELRLRATLLLKPAIEVTPMFVEPVPPVAVETRLGVAVMEKSGVAPTVTLTVNVVLVFVLGPVVALICA